MKKIKLMAAILAAVMITACGNEAQVSETKEEPVKEAVTEAVTETEETVAADTEDGEPLENADAYEEEPAEEVKLAVNVMEHVKASAELPEMYDADDAHIINNYGIDTDTLDSFAVCEALEVTRADKIILIDPKDGTDASEIKDKLESFRQDKMTEMQDYLPEQYDVIAAASVKEIGDLICLVISPDAETIESLIKEAITE